MLVNADIQPKNPQNPAPQNGNFRKFSDALKRPLHGSRLNVDNAKAERPHAIEATLCNPKKPSSNNFKREFWETVKKRLQTHEIGVYSLLPLGYIFCIF